MWFFIIFTIIVLTLKAYLFRGLRQAFPSKKKWVAVWTTLSILTYAIGLPTMYYLFESTVIVTERLFPNIITALMLSVLICEILLLGFFIIDDILHVGQWTYGKIAKKEEAFESDKTQSRRRFLKTAGTFITAVPFASYLYGITVGKYQYTCFRQTLNFPDLPKAFDGLKIVQFSDMHSGSFDNKESVAEGIKKIQAEAADLIVFTGDLVNEYAEEIIPYKELLAQLSAPLGKFAVLGNHDYPWGDSKEDKVINILQHHKDMGFKVLLNEHETFTKNGEELSLVGVENWGKSRHFPKKGDLDKAVTGLPDDRFSVLLSHDPTHWDEKVKDHPKHIHLTLSGHTHGAQMGVELAWLKWSPVKYIYKKWAGLYDELGQYLYINRGFGFLGFAGRVGIPPEITVITLKKS